MSAAGSDANARGARRPSIAGSAVATGKGDDGTTGLLYGGRVPKDDPRTEAYGTLDEAVAALGIARAEWLTLETVGHLPAALADLGPMLLRLQRELFVAGAELATGPDAWERLRDGETRVDEAMLVGLEGLLSEIEARVVMPREFVIPGGTRLSAGLELARTIVRRAERRVIGLDREHLVPGDRLIPYLNRLADLLWVAARLAEQGAGVTSTPSRPAGAGAAPGAREEVRRRLRSEAR